MQAELDQFRTRCDELNLKSEEQDTQRKKLAIELTELKSLNGELSEKIKSASPKLKTYKEEIKELKSKLSSAEDHVSKTKNASSDQAKKFGRLEQELTDLASRLNRQSQELDQQKRAFKDQTGQLEKALLENARLEKALLEKESIAPPKPADPMPVVRPSENSGAPAPQPEFLDSTDGSLSEPDELNIPNAVPSPPPTQVPRPHEEDSLVQPDSANVAVNESKGDHSSLAMQSNEPQDNTRGDSSILPSQVDQQYKLTVNFRVRERKGGNVVLKKNVDDGEIIRIGRLVDYCTFPDLARRLSTDRVLSGRHFELIFGRDRVTVNDIGSTNGTLAGGELLKKKKKIIAYDDFVDHYIKIRAGELYHFELELIDVPLPAQTAPPPDLGEETETDLAELKPVQPAPKPPVIDDEGEIEEQHDSINELNFQSNPGDPPMHQDNSSSRDSLEWGDE